jgi:hypothetical protein
VPIAWLSWWLAAALILRAPPLWWCHGCLEDVMDIRCPICLEPWDMDSLHDLVKEGQFPSFNDARRAFTSQGCGVAFASWGVTCVPTERKGGAAIASELYDLLGDDIDGAAALLEDAEMFGYLED